MQRHETIRLVMQMETGNGYGSLKQKGLKPGCGEWQTRGSISTKLSWKQGNENCGWSKDDDVCGWGSEDGARTSLGERRNLLHEDSGCQIGQCAIVSAAIAADCELTSSHGDW